jgi:hypothetical protein
LIAEIKESSGIFFFFLNPPPFNPTSSDKRCRTPRKWHSARLPLWLGPQGSSSHLTRAPGSGIGITLTGLSFDPCFGFCCDRDLLLQRYFHYIERKTRIRIQNVTATVITDPSGHRRRTVVAVSGHGYSAWLAQQLVARFSPPLKREALKLVSGSNPNENPRYIDGER